MCEAPISDVQRPTPRSGNEVQRPKEHMPHCPVHDSDSAFRAQPPIPTGRWGDCGIGAVPSHFLQGKRVLEILPSWEGPPLMSIAACASQTGDPSMGFRVADPDLPAQKATADRSNGDDLTARLQSAHAASPSMFSSSPAICCFLREGNL